MNDRQGRREAREREERDADRAEETLAPKEREQVERSRRLSAVAIYTIVRREGEEELHRPAQSLWWSGLAAGIGISASVLGQAVLHDALAGHEYRDTLAKLGYTLGFIVVIVSRLQLFTENTITVILPVLADPARRKLWFTARLWSIVFAANLVGTFVTGLFTLYVGTATPDTVDAMLEVSRGFAEHSASEALLLGIPAGFFIAAIVWMVPAVRGSEVLVIGLMTYLIALGEFSHVIVGAAEAFLLILSGELGVLHGMFGLVLPALVGNVIGGTGLFALLAYAQVREEV